MPVTRDLDPAFRELPIPAVFMEEHLKELDFPALKCYLCLLYASELEGMEIRDAAKLSGLNDREWIMALQMLEQKQLIQMEGQEIRLRELRHVFRRPSRDGGKVADAQRALLKKVSMEREDVIRQINDAFFQGMMPTQFYRYIDRWIEKYQFEYTVIYSLFSEASNYQQETTVNYVDAIARNWHRQGIRSFEELESYFQRREKLQGLAKKVRERLLIRNELNFYQLERLEKWSLTWGFDFPVIDEALRRASRSGPANFDMADAILNEWHEAGLKDVREIQDYEAKRRRQNPRQRPLPDHVPRGNFTQREYRAEDMEALYTELSHHPDKEQNS